MGASFHLFMGRSEGKTVGWEALWEDTPAFLLGQVTF